MLCHISTINSIDQKPVYRKIPYEHTMTKAFRNFRKLSNTLPFLNRCNPTGDPTGLLQLLGFNVESATIVDLGRLHTFDITLSSSTSFCLCDHSTMEQNFLSIMLY